MTKDNRKDLALSLRKNRGQRVVGEWSVSLCRACGVQVSAIPFLSLERTEKLKRAFFERVKSESKKPKLYWEKREWSEVAAHLIGLCTHARNPAVILFSSIDEFVGAVRIPADAVLKNALPVWEVVKDDLCLTTEDLQHGLCLEENFYTPSGNHVREGFFELTAWGQFTGLASLGT